MPVIVESMRLVGYSFSSCEIGRYAVAILPDVQRHGQLLERSVSGALADAVDRAFDLAHAGVDRGERIRQRQAEIVVAMRAQHDIRMRAEPRAHLAEHFRIFVRRRIADRVGQIDDRRAAFHGGQNDLAEIIDIGAACILGGKFHFFAVLAGRSAPFS